MLIIISTLNWENIAPCWWEDQTMRQSMYVFINPSTDLTQRPPVSQWWLRVLQLKMIFLPNLHNNRSCFISFINKGFKFENIHSQTFKNVWILNVKSLSWWHKHTSSSSSSESGFDLMKNWKIRTETQQVSPLPPLGDSNLAQEVRRAACSLHRK